MNILKIERLTTVFHNREMMLGKAKVLAGVAMYAGATWLLTVFGFAATFVLVTQNETFTHAKMFPTVTFALFGVAMPIIALMFLEGHLLLNIDAWSGNRMVKKLVVMVPPVIFMITMAVLISEVPSLLVHIKWLNLILNETSDF